LKKLTLELSDGKHIISTPTFAAIALMEDNGIDLAAGVNLASAKTLCGVLAAMLTASEPLVDGHFARTWTPEEAGMLIDGESMGRIAEVLGILFDDAYPNQGDDSSPSPSRRPRANRQ